MSNSRDKANCPVSGCDVSTRMDKLKKHFQQSVLWDDNNSACHPSNPRYRISTKKFHTDYARNHNIRSDAIPSFKT